MIKKIALISLILSQVTISCSSDDSNSGNTPEKTIEEQITEIANLPYSSLTPEQQKVKLEKEANEMLVQLDKSKTSSALEAFENLNRLLEINDVDLLSNANKDQVENIINTSDVYGIYSWNNTNQVWDKTTSTTELKFVFPAKESQTSNNATFSTKSISSDIKVKDNNNSFFLPTSTAAVLSIDNAEAATITLNAKYVGTDEIPTEAGYKITTNDGYSWEVNGKKSNETAANASFNYNGKNLISFNSGSTANIDELIKDESLIQYRGKANGLITLMDNFVIVADMDLANQAIDDKALTNSNTEPTPPYFDMNGDLNAKFKAYYTDRDAYLKKKSEGTVANFNKNLKLILVSKKDGTKIADIIQHSEQTDSWEQNIPTWVADPGYNEGGYWSYDEETFKTYYYDEVPYLKFGDNTEVEMGAYFSTGFADFNKKFQNFIMSFKK